MSETLTDAERARYSRHLLLPEIGEAGQTRLKNARVLFVGAGGLGSPAALYLAAAGVGVIGLADTDTVAVHNLQRQILHRDADTGRPKVDSGADTLRALNPGVRVETHPEGVTVENALSLFSRYDVVLDGSDNFATRRLVNDACVLAGKPLVAGSVFRFEGQLAVYDAAAGGPCYRCLFPESPAPGTVPGCGEAGVVGALCGVIGSWQALETVKLLTGAGTTLRGKLMIFDGLSGKTRTLSVPKNPECPCCGEHPRISTLDPEEYGPSVCAAPRPDPFMENLPLEITVEQARDLLAGPAAPILLDVRNDDEVALCHIPGSVHIPMQEIPYALERLPRDRAIIVQCHLGGRSMRVTQFLRGQGYERVTNLGGGIDRWSVVIDPSIARY